MRHYALDESPLWVEVVFSKSDGHIETRKYLGEELVCQVSGSDFRKTMIHTTVIRLADG